jgi:transcriptional regulator with XRE-family HTH domain
MQDMATIDVQHFRENVRTVCNEHGRGAIARLAEGADISRPFLSNFLNGVNSISFEVAIDLARALQISLDVLSLPPSIFRKSRSKPKKSA